MLVISPYEALEDNEINLVEGEYIYNVEQVDDGTWKGTTAEGKTGLFPASYVEELGAREAETPPPQPAVRAAPNSVSSAIQAPQQPKKKKKRKGKDDDDDSKFLNIPQPASSAKASARARQAPQKYSFAVLEQEGVD